MYCPNCACELPAVAKFCVRCGSRIGVSEESRTGQINAISASAHETSSSVASAPALDPRRAKFPKAERGDCSSDLQVMGSHFVIPAGVALPNHCVKCGNAPVEPWLELTFSWHDPALYLVLFLGILPYVIVSAFVAKKVTLSVPLCVVHKEKRRKRLWTGWLLLVGCIPLSVGMSFVGNEAASSLAIWLGIGLFAAGIIFLRSAAPLKARHIGRSSAEFSGACNAFLISIEQSTTLGSVQPLAAPVE